MKEQSRQNRKGFLLAFLFLVMVLSSLIRADAASFSKKAPTMKAKVSGTKVTLSWSKRSDLTGYQIYETGASGGNRRLLKTSRSTRYVRSGLEEGKTYYYRIRGYYKGSGKKQYTSFGRVVKVKIPSGGRKSTLKKLLQVALQPVGSTMYVWGGGWNKADTGAGKAARTIGVSPVWKQFFQKQTSSYDYRTTRYQISNGLDCSGYVGWCIYNVMNTENGKPGYVMLAQNMAGNYASRGWGTCRNRYQVKNYRAGDIMSSNSHVWIAVGQCGDGSVVLLHSSPPGVQLVGTPSATGTAYSQAVRLAAYYMKKYYPAWYRKYPNCSRDSSYLSNYDQMRWDLSGKKVMTDPDGYRNMSAGQILEDLFS